MCNPIIPTFIAALIDAQIDHYSCDAGRTPLNPFSRSPSEFIVRRRRSTETINKLRRRRSSDGTLGTALWSTAAWRRRQGGPAPARCSLLLAPPPPSSSSASATSRPFAPIFTRSGKRQSRRGFGGQASGSNRAVSAAAAAATAADMADSPTVIRDSWRRSDFSLLRRTSVRVGRMPRLLRATTAADRDIQLRPPVSHSPQAVFPFVCLSVRLSD